MNWFQPNSDINSRFPEIEDVSAEIPAISQFMDAFRLPDAFKRFETDTLPVTTLRGEVVGIVSEFDLAKAVTNWSLADDGYTKKLKVTDIMTKDVWTETAKTNIEMIISKVPQMHKRVIPIVDEEGAYTGKCITRTALVSYLTGRVKPQTLGGLATPLGVYMTDGLHQAGAKNPGLILTGMTFSLIAVVIKTISTYTSHFIHMPAFASGIFELFLFLVILRVSPLSKIHAAEHKTINAIERGIPLTVEAIKTQSRVHSRCGTNLLVFVLGAFTVMFLSTILIDAQNFILKFFILLIGFLFVMTYWKKIGNMTQKYFTTTEPDDKYIESGIKAGEELLMLHKRDVKHVYPTFFTRFWNMGIIQIASSFYLVLWFIDKFIL